MDELENYINEALNIEKNSDEIEDFSQDLIDPSKKKTSSRQKSHLEKARKEKKLKNHARNIINQQREEFWNNLTTYSIYAGTGCLVLGLAYYTIQQNNVLRQYAKSLVLPTSSKNSLNQPPIQPLYNPQRRNFIKPKPTEPIKEDVIIKDTQPETQEQPQEQPQEQLQEQPREQLQELFLLVY